MSRPRQRGRALAWLFPAPASRPRRRGRALAWLFTAPASRRRGGALAWLLGATACAPIVYQIDDAGESDDDDDDDETGAPTTEGPQPTPTGEVLADPTAPDPSDPSGPPGATCGDGEWNGDESDLDCGGTCVPCGPGATCDDPKDCQDGQCLAGRCADAGACVGPEDCAYLERGLPCVAGFCGLADTCELLPAHEGEPCDDGDLCTQGDACSQGACVGKQSDCSGWGGACATGFCNPRTGNCALELSQEGEPCEDGDPCTLGEQCSGGACVSPWPTPALFDDFSGGFGWELGELWQIGPAVASACAEAGADDPPSDHSPGPDERLAGALIGDCLPDAAFMSACMTSPPLAMMLLPQEPLALRFWSVLGHPGPPLVSTVEAFDGQAWTPLLVFEDPVAEPTWTEHVVDLTPFVHPELRVRFCHAGQGAPMPKAGGWSVDDVSIGPPMCLP